MKSFIKKISLIFLSCFSLQSTSFSETFSEITVENDLNVAGEIINPYFIAGEGNSATVVPDNWYRIAENASPHRASAEFLLNDTISGGGHSSVKFRIGVSYNDDIGMGFTLLGHHRFSKTTFSKIRVLEKDTDDDQFLEVYVKKTGNTPHEVSFAISDNLQNSGWNAINWDLGNVPANYTVHEFDLDNLFAVGDYENRFVIQRGGNVGIGTSTPEVKLQITTPAQYYPGAYSMFGDAFKVAHDHHKHDVPMLTMYNNYGPVYLTAEKDNHQGTRWGMAFRSLHTMQDGTMKSNTGNLSFSSGESGWGIVIDRSNNVGVGTHVPQARLHVAGDVIVNGNITASEPQAPNHIATQFYVDDKTANLSEAAVTAVTDGLYLKKTGGEITGDLFVSAGKLGLGTTDPQYQLHIVTEENPTDVSYFAVDNPYAGTNKGNGSGLRFRLGGDRQVTEDRAAGIAGISLNQWSSKTALAFYTHDEVNDYPNNCYREVARIDPSGNLGLGTTTPTARLDVSGDAVVRGVLRVHPAGDLSMDGFTDGTPPPSN